MWAESAAAYGKFLGALDSLELEYLIGIQSTLSLWAPAEHRCPPKSEKPQAAARSIHPKQPLLLLPARPQGEAAPTKYWLGTVSAKMKLPELVRLAQQRWIIERDYEELKQELGLGHFEGRG